MSIPFTVNRSWTCAMICILIALGHGCNRDRAEPSTQPQEGSTQATTSTPSANPPAAPGETRANARRVWSPPAWSSPSEEAVKALFAELCPGSSPQRKGRSYTCAKDGRTIQAQVRVGHFLRKPEQEALVAVRDSAAPNGKGGYLVLMREVRSESWRKVHTFDALGPGTGFLTFQAMLVDGDGLNLPVVCHQTCQEGCCQGACSSLRFVSDRGKLSMEQVALLAIGSQGGTQVQVKRVAFDDVNGDGSSDLVLHRHTDREGQGSHTEAVSFVLDGQGLKATGPKPAKLPFACPAQ